MNKTLRLRHIYLFINLRSNRSFSLFLLNNTIFLLTRFISSNHIFLLWRTYIYFKKPLLLLLLLGFLNWIRLLRALNRRIATVGWKKLSEKLSWLIGTLNLIKIIVFIFNFLIWMIFLFLLLLLLLLLLLFIAICICIICEILNIFIIVSNGIGRFSSHGSFWL